MAYQIEWENELSHPESPLEAARACYEDIKNGEALAFTVTDLKTGQRYSVDLNEEEGEEVLEIGE